VQQEPAAVEEVRAGSWAELHEALFAGSWQEAIGRHRSNDVFRGQACAGQGLETSLMRLGGDYASLEASLLRNFRKYARRDAVDVDSPWDWLALAKHHGLPTRVLDWTFSPYVALHFATASPVRYDEDGAIWCVDYVTATRRLPSRLSALLEQERSSVFTTELLSSVAAGLEQLDELLGREHVVFFEPPSLDQRILNQFAVFSLQGDATARMDEWLERRPGLGRRVVIPAELKWEVRDKLDQANVNERVLFPGLDGLSRWLARHYASPDGETETGCGAWSPARHEEEVLHGA
jgi:hypothetical protein